MTKALAYIEIDIPFCANTYGVAPCTASLTSSPPTGTRKCFNTPNTCQDRENYIDAPVTLRFSSDVGFLPDDIDAFPYITAISYTPTVLSLGKDVGTRASLQVTFKDAPWSDTGPGFDKYLSERPYNPMEQGTFWGKFRARQPFLRGRAMRLIRGSLGQAIGDMETHHYIIDSFSHNTADGSYTLVAKDVLKFTDDDRSQAPVVSQGFLVSDITAADVTATLSPTGIGNEEYEETGYLAIAGKEIVSFQRDATAGNDANTKLLMHLGGVDASTVFTDVSTAAHVATTNGNAQVDTAQKKFGTGSALFDGSGDSISFADHADWTPAGNFTIDFWVRWNALATTQFLFIHATDSNNRYFLSASATGVLTFSVVSASVTIVTMASAAGVVSAGGLFNHIAVVRNGNVWNIYVDGVSVATTTDSDAIPNFTSLFRIGTDQAGSNGFNGWIDEFRFSNIARWTAPFTPPVSAYQTSGDILAIVRAQLNTEAINHEAQDRVQTVLQYASQDVADIIRDLAVNYAGILDSYIPIDTWRTETASFLDRVFSANIAEPTGVQTLINELIEDAALSIWWDDVGQQLRLRVLRAIATDAFTFDQGIYLEGTFSSREQPAERVSQVWRFFAKRNPLDRSDNADNYRSVAASIDLQAETDYGSSVIHKIFSRWIPFGGRSVADKANTLYLSRFRDPPRRFNFSVFRSDDIVIPELGQGYRIEGMGLQDDTGAASDAPIQITRLNPGDAQFDIEAEEMLVVEQAPEDLINRVIVIDGNTTDINLEDLHNTLYPVATDQDVIDGVNLICYIETGVSVGASIASAGSANVAGPAFTIGDWPVGFPITLVVNGRIQGAGGRGGSNALVIVAASGQKGGSALYTRFPINLEVGAGEIWGGGGGGGAGEVTGNPGNDPSSGGGGGAGFNPGTGGIHSTFNSVPGDDGDPGTITTGGAGGNITNKGGAGGGPGIAGTNGSTSGAGIVVKARGLGGAAGNSVDGISFVTITVGPGSFLGPQIN